MYKVLILNGAYFKVNKEKFEEMERNAFQIDPMTGELIKDYIMISEWIEKHGIELKH